MSVGADNVTTLSAPAAAPCARSDGSSSLSTAVVLPKAQLRRAVWVLQNSSFGQCAVFPLDDSDRHCGTLRRTQPLC